MKKTVHVILATALALVLVLLILWQVNKFFERQTIKEVGQKTDLEQVSSAEEYEQLSASLAPTTDNAIPLEDSISDELRESLLPRN